MNTKLEDLAYQAADKTKFFCQITEWEQMHALLEKFAELVIEASFDTVIADGRFHDARRVIRSAKYVAMEHFRS